MAGAPKGSRNAAISDQTFNVTAKVAMTDEMRTRYQKHAKAVHGIDLSKLIRKLLDEDVKRARRPYR